MESTPSSEATLARSSLSGTRGGRGKTSLTLVGGTSIEWHSGALVRLPTELLDEYKPISSLGAGVYGQVYLAKRSGRGSRDCLDKRSHFSSCRPKNGDGLEGPSDKTRHEPERNEDENEGCRRRSSDTDMSEDFYEDCRAVKVLSRVMVPEGLPATTIRELALLRGLQHENVITLERIFVGNESVALIFPYGGVDLASILDQHVNSNTFIDRSVVVKWMWQVALAVEYIHSKDIIHRDLKPQNILVRPDRFSRPGREKVRVADLGLARICGISEAHEAFNNSAVTLWYRPPELLLGRGSYGKSCDIFSLGCLFAEMMLTRPIFPGMTELDMLQRSFSLLELPPDIYRVYPELRALPFLDIDAMRSVRPKLEHFCSRLLGPCASDLLLSMLSIDPSRRPTSTEVLRHPLFQSLYTARFCGSASSEAPSLPASPALHRQLDGDTSPPTSVSDPGMSPEKIASYLNKLVYRSELNPTQPLPTPQQVYFARLADHI